jgi:hypothetical protein
MEGFSGTIHYDISTMLRKVPISNPLYDRDIFVSHTWGCLTEYKFIHTGQENFKYILILCSVFFLPKHFAVNMNGIVRGFPFPSHV